MSSNMHIPKVCQFCGKEFIAKKISSKTCSDNCAKRLYKKIKREEKLSSVPEIDAQKVQVFSNQLKDKEFLSISETCLLLGASRMTVYRLIQSKALNNAKLGRRIIIKRSDIDKLFES